MKVTKIKNDVWKFDGIASVYLIEDDGWMLVDAGDGKDKAALAENISRIVPLDKVETILLTHLHHDHLGCIDLFPNAEIYASEEEIAAYVENPEIYSFYLGEKLNRILKEKMKALPGAISGLAVLGVPGHTSGSVAFLDRKRKLLFSGDTIFGGDIIGRTDLPNSLPEKMGASVKMLRELVVDEGLGLCPGHGY